MRRAAVVGCGGSATHVRPSPVEGRADHQIVPGARIGAVALGMTDADVLAVLGPPEVPLPPDLIGHWGPLTIRFHREAWVMSVATSDPADVTPEGLHVGSTLVEVESRMGTADRIVAHPLRDPAGVVVQDYARHCYAGVMYDLGGESNVSQIAVANGCED